MLSITNSNALKNKAKSLLPLLAQTFSKSPSSFVEGVFPVYAEKANGSRFTDVDGNEYIDYLLSLGPIVLGYNYKRVNDAIKNQLEKGVIFSLPHILEIEAAEALKRIIPCAEMTHFTKTGSDAVTGAIRAARSITGRDIILYCGGGGVWDDWYSIITTRNKGIPKFNQQLIKVFQYNNLVELEELFRKHQNSVAVVVMEPATLELPRDDFLNKVKKMTHENGALLIFDEILTGFRLSRGGAQELFGVTPDMATFGKGIANGMPLAAIVGKSDYMKEFEEVFVSTTYGGEALSLAACVATINEFEEKDVCGHMKRMGDMIQNEFNKITKENDLDAECIGISPRLKFIIKDKTGKDSLLYKSLFLQELIERGIFMHPNVVNVCFSHTEDDINLTLDAINESLSFLKKSIEHNDVKDKLKGEVAKEVISSLV